MLMITSGAKNIKAITNAPLAEQGAAAGGRATVRARAGISTHPHAN